MNYQQMTSKQLSQALTEAKIKGRSKATLKAQKIALLVSHQPTFADMLEIVPFGIYYAVRHKDAPKLKFLATARTLKAITRKLNKIKREAA